jgi:Family of unknown function (DUF6159)
MGQSWRVLQLDRELLLFPVFSTIACLLVMASFAAPLALSPELREAVFSASREGEAQAIADGAGALTTERATFGINLPRAALAAASFLFYCVTNFVIVYFNTALVSCAMIRFSGGNPTLGDGLRAATARAPQIIGWVLLSATVGTILRAIEERVPLVGKIVVSLIGMAWAVVTFMVVPILAAEGVGPITAVKRSASLLRKTWGESLVGQFSLGFVQFLFLLPVIVGVVGSVVGSIAMESVWPIVIGGSIAVAYTVVLAIVFSTLRQIFLAAVYQFAQSGGVPAGFSAELISAAFKPKGSK